MQKSFELVHAHSGYRDFEPSFSVPCETGLDTDGEERDHLGGVQRVTLCDLTATESDYLSMLDGTTKEVSRDEAERIIATGK